MAAGYVVLYWYAGNSLAVSPLTRQQKRISRWAISGFTACVAIFVPFYLIYDFAPSWLVPGVMSQTVNTYYGKSGVVEVCEDGNMYWDGLWHSQLSIDGNHVGRANWNLAAIPILCHGGESIDDTLVIGMGTGITAATLARSNRVKSVDVYEIDFKLERLLQDYPDGTLNVATNPKVNLIWQDGRAGLALNEKTYDLITQQPYYLMQSGSSMLLSKEYMALVKSRLKPNGVFCIYSNSQGIREQALLVRRTAAEVFRYYESFSNGYMIVASDSPISFDVSRFTDDNYRDPFTDEIRSLGAENIAKTLDRPRLSWEDCDYVISDDHPLVEYPGVVQFLLRDTSSAR